MIKQAILRGQIHLRRTGTRSRDSTRRADSGGGKSLSPMVERSLPKKQLLTVTGEGSSGRKRSIHRLAAASGPTTSYTHP